MSNRSRRLPTCLILLALTVASSGGAQTPVTLQRADNLLPAGADFPRSAEYKDVELVQPTPGGPHLLYLPVTRPSNGLSEESMMVWNPVSGEFDDVTAARLGSLDPNEDRGTYDVDFVDVDGDGDYDIVHSSPHGNRLLINNGAEVFSDDTIARFPFFLYEDKVNVWDDVVAGDIDADGDFDLAFSNRTKSITGHDRNWGPNVLLYNDGEGFFNRAPINHVEFGAPSDDDPAQIEGSSHGIKMADVNNDGRLDLVISHARNYTSTTAVDAPKVEFLLNQGDPDGDGLVNWDTSTAPINSGSYVINVGTFDFDNDGNLDLYLAHGGLDRLFLGDGSGGFPNTIAVPASVHGSDSYDVAFGDLNYDGFLDIATPPADGGDIKRALYLNNAGNSLTVSNDNLLNDDGEDVFRLSTAFADVDLDGDLDMVWGADARGGDESPLVLRNTSNPNDNVDPRIEHPSLFLAANGDPAAVFRVRLSDRLVEGDELDAELTWSATRSDTTSTPSQIVDLEWAANLTYQARISCADLRAGAAANATITEFTGTVNVTDVAGNTNSLDIDAADGLASALDDVAGAGLSLDILEPRETAPAPVQPMDGTGRMLIRVAYRPLNLEPRFEDFRVRIGGVAATIVTGERVGSEFWLAVVPPAGIATTSNLEVGYRLCDAAVITTEFNAVPFGEPRLSDTVMVIDTSGSMGDDQKLDSARNAASVFIDVLRDADRIGIVEYSGYAPSGLGDADQHFPIDLAGGARGPAQNSLASLNDSGDTPIGMGLLKGLEELDSVLPATDRNDIRALVLLSDGMENVPHFWGAPPAWYTAPPANEPVVDTFNLPVNSEVQIHTVSLGPDADHGLMFQISSGRGDHRQVDLAETPVNAFFDRVAPGEFALAADNALQLANLPLAHRLANQYEHFHNAVSEQQRLWQGTYTTKGSQIDVPQIGNLDSDATSDRIARHETIPSKTVQHKGTEVDGWQHLLQRRTQKIDLKQAQQAPRGEVLIVPVEPGLDYATLTLNWEAPNSISAQLVPPAGQVGAIEQSSSGTNTVFRIQQPVAGDWRVAINAVRGIPLLVTLSGESDEQAIARVLTGNDFLETGNKQHVVRRILPAGSEVPIALTLFGSQPVTTATVNAIAIGPGAQQSFQLRDNGIAPDNRAGDGIYSGVLTETDRGGVFDIELLASWLGGDGVQRERVVPLAVVLAEIDSDGDTISDDDEIGAGLDPNDPSDVGEDPDGDGLVNWKEVLIGTDPFDPDSDDGGANDGLEIWVGTDPQEPADDDQALLDSDGDSMPDLWENKFGLDPTDPSDANEDPDGDGIKNSDEFKFCTSPVNRDTDDDNIGDDEEIAQGTDPTDPDNRAEPVDDPCDPQVPVPTPSTDEESRFSLSAHVGVTAPFGDLDDVADDGALYEFDLEYHFDDQFSLEGVLGRYEFDDAGDIEGFALRAQRQWNLSPALRGYLAAGPGLHHLEGGSSALSLSLAAGLRIDLGGQWDLDLGPEWFHLFSTGGQDEIDFGAVRLGLHYRIP